MKAYKGFNRDMTCTPADGVKFQFEEGKTYEEQEAVLCKKGFHACEHPLGCFGYYAPAKSVFHEVELEEVCEGREEDTKVAGKKITIGARLDIAGMVKAAVDFVFAKADWSKKENHATGDQGAASATGRWGAASATGKEGVALAAGYQGKAKGAKGCVICCVERGEWNGKTYPILAAKAAIVDGKTIKADTWYTLKGGEFVEVKEE